MDICVFMGKSQYHDFPWKIHNILDIHRKSKLFLAIHGKSKNILDFPENLNYFGFPRKSELFWISMDNPKYFGFSRKIQIILDIHRQSKYFGYPQKIHNIIGFPSWENHNIAQTIYSNKEIVLQQY